MSNWDISVVTDAGVTLLNKIEGGAATAVIDTIAIGSGIYNSSEKATIARRTALKAQQLSAGINSKQYPDSNTLEVKTSIDNTTVVTGFDITECGVYATVTEGGTTSTILFAIAYTETPDYMAAYNGEYPQIVIEDFYLPISNGAAVSVTMSQSAYALAEDLDDLKDEVDSLESTVAGKQDRLTFDNTPTANSTNPVKSGGVYSSLSSLGNSINTLSENVSSLSNSFNTLSGKTYKSDDAVETEIDDADYIPFYDTSAGAMKKISKSNANFGGGGSVINLTTGDEGLLGQAVTISDGVTTLSGQFSQEGECTFNGVVLTGTLTISSTAEGAQVTDTVEVPYYGTYTKNFGRNAKTIDITTDEPTLLGQTVTATYGAKTKTATISAQGTASITLYNYTGAVTLSATDGEETAEVNITVTSETDTYTAELGFIKIYGVSWDGGSSPAMTRTDAAAGFADPVPQMKSGSGWTVGSSPFDNILPWSGMEIVDDTTAGKLVKIPKYYYKWTKTGTSMTLQISEKSFDGSHVSPAHADRGDGSGERDFVYVGRYHCASDYKSKTGVGPANNYTREQFRNSIHNLGSDIWQYDFAMFWTINMLYLVEFANWNSQATIGYGCGNNSSAENAGATDSMTYHTGTNQSSKTAYGHTQYRYIEDLWGNVYDWCDGIRFSGADVYIINNPASFSDSSGGTKVGTRPTSDGYISAWSLPSVSGLEWALYPSAVSGSESTYICDYCDYYSSGVVLRVGGNYSQNQYHGAFCLVGDSAAYKYSDVGSRLQKLP